MQEMQGMRVQSLGWEGPPEEGMATQSSTLAWRTPDRGAWWATARGIAESERAEAAEHGSMSAPPLDSETRLSMSGGQQKHGQRPLGRTGPHG